MLYDFLKRFAVRPLLKIFFRIDLTGTEHVPPTGAAILASNHLSVSDSVFLPASLERPVVFLAKDEYFNGTVEGALHGLVLPLDQPAADGPLRGSEVGPVTGQRRRGAGRGQAAGHLPGAPAPRTAGCTGPSSGWRSWPWKAGRR